MPKRTAAALDISSAVFTSSVMFPRKIFRSANFFRRLGISIQKNSPKICPILPHCDQKDDSKHGSEISIIDNSHSYTSCLTCNKKRCRCTFSKITKNPCNRISDYNLIPFSVSSFSKRRIFFINSGRRVTMICSRPHSPCGRAGYPI